MSAICAGLLGCAKRSTPNESCPATESRGPLRWFTDDLEAASTCARRRSLPIFIDLWAPWCHTCLSMKQTVLVDERLAPFSERFVWLEVDTDRPENHAVVERYPPLAWPTFYVVDAERGRLLARFVGGASVDQIEALLEEAEAVRRKAEDKPLAALIRAAHHAESERAWTKASTLYEEALRSAPPRWARRPDVLVSVIRTYVRAEAWDTCMGLAEREGTHTGRSASAADFAAYAHRCARERRNQRGNSHEGSRTDSEVLEGIADHVLSAVDKARAAPPHKALMSLDDRSDALRILREIALFRGRKKEARDLAERQRALLDAARKGAEPRTAMTYNWPAAEVYTFLGEPEALLPALEANMAALPEDYDPPYRLAWLLLQAARAEEARRYAVLALERAYGPRKAQVYRLLARIEGARGDPTAEIAALQGALSVLEALPAQRTSPAALEAAREALSAAQSRHRSP